MDLGPEKLTYWHVSVDLGLPCCRLGVAVAAWLQVLSARVGELWRLSLRLVGVASLVV